MTITQKQKNYQKLYRQTKEYKVAQKRYRQSERGKALRRIARKSCDKKYKAEHSKQIKAINIVNYAVIVGKLPRPDTLHCNNCPAQAQHYHHYKGYKKPNWLDVIPICRECHRKIHKKSA